MTLGGPKHRVLAGAVGVETQHEHRRDALELADLLLGQSGSHDPDGVGQARLVQREHVGVALDQNHVPGSGRGARARSSPNSTSRLW